MHGFGIGPVELLIILIVGAVIVFAIRRRGTASGGTNQLHPNLKECPGCGAPLTQNLDTCPQCGLRISA